MSTATTDGTLETRDDVHVLRFERRLAHPIDRVWAAITEPSGILRWLGEAEIDLVEGGRVTIRWLNRFSAEQAERYGIEGMEEGHEESVMNAAVARLDPPRLLELESDVFGQLRFELFEDRMAACCGSRTPSRLRPRCSPSRWPDGTSTSTISSRRSAAPPSTGRVGPTITSPPGRRSATATRRRYPNAGSWTRRSG